MAIERKFSRSQCKFQIEIRVQKQNSYLDQRPLPVLTPWTINAARGFVRPWRRSGPLRQARDHGSSAGRGGSRRPPARGSSSWPARPAIRDAASAGALRRQETRVKAWCRRFGPLCAAADRPGYGARPPRHPRRRLRQWVGSMSSTELNYCFYGSWSVVDGPSETPLSACACTRVNLHERTSLVFYRVSVVRARSLKLAPISYSTTFRG